MLAADALHRALSSLAGSGLPLAEPPSDGGERVLVALSGGVDSAVAALREREAGREVVAVTLKLWADQHTDGESSCCSPEAVLGARRLAHALGIPHLTLDLEGEFRDGVVAPFLRGYAEGRTPIPCVLCNGELRIDAMIALADRLGAAKLATGHYARIADDGSGPLLASASDPAKDQTYMLSGLRPGSLRRLRFPLGELTKPRVREIAAEAGLGGRRAGGKPGPLLPRRAGQARVLRRHAGLDDRRGEIVDPSGRRLGRALGHHRLHGGQRRGLGVGEVSRATCCARMRPRTGRPPDPTISLRRRGSASGGEPSPRRRARRRRQASLSRARPRLPGRARRRGRARRCGAGRPSSARPRDSRLPALDGTGRGTWYDNVEQPLGRADPPGSEARSRS